jgi:reactive intermediate/imine deaminase
MSKTAYNPDTMNKPFGIFSNATLAGPGRLYFISGQVAVDAQGRLVGRGDIRAQTRQVLGNIKAALAAVGGTMDDVACVNVFVVDMDHLQAIHEVRAEYWQQEYPASTLVQVSRLVSPDYLIEINAIAVVSTS